mgnify:CR=1 FL=1
MSRQCMRPGCDRRASACLTYDADRSEGSLRREIRRLERELEDLREELSRIDDDGEI